MARIISMRARVVLQDGTAAFPVIPQQDLVERLRCGDTVLLEAQARALLFRNTGVSEVGEEARLERRIGPDRVEVTLRDIERAVFRASADLREQLAVTTTRLLPPRSAVLCGQDARSAKADPLCAPGVLARNGFHAPRSCSRWACTDSASASRS
ncbi:MAG: hypothetical protein IT429_11270 [Gemmataceae bacterium]|nr:hypothetical protein [Gemmataceae bacterium]